MVSRASDPTSLFKMQEYVSRLSVDQLKNEIQNNTGSVPSWMLISALQDKLRANASGMQAQKPSSTVASDLIRRTSEPQQVGIGSLVPREEASEPQAMAHGGVIKMQTGGSPDEARISGGWLGDAMGWLGDAIRNQRIDESQLTPEERQILRLSNPPGELDRNQLLIPGARTSAGLPPRGQSIPPYLYSSGENLSAVPNRDMPQSTSASSSGSPTEEDVPLWSLPPKPPGLPVRMSSPNASGAGAIGGGLGSTGGRGAGIAGISAAAPSGAQPDVFGNMRSAFAVERKAVDDLLDMAKSERESSKEQKENAKWEAMLHAGLNIMAAGAKTGNALGAIGAGAAAGAQQFSSNLKDIRKDQREKILDELKARQLKLDSLAKEGVIDYHQLHEQNAMALGQARLQAASAAGHGNVKTDLLALNNYSARASQIESHYNNLIEKSFDPKQQERLREEMRKSLQQLETLYTPYISGLQFDISGSPRNPRQ